MTGIVDAQYLIISSDDRDRTRDVQGYTTTDFRVRLPKNVDTKKKKVKLIDIIMNMASYSVESTRRRIVVEIPSLPATYTVDLEIGNYNATQIASDLQTKLNTAGSGDSAVFTVVYNTYNYRMRITLEVATVATNFKLVQLDQSDNIGRKLGFDYATESELDDYIAAPAMVQLYDLYATIAIDEFKQNIITTDGTNIPKTFMMRIISRSGESNFKIDDDRYEFYFDKTIEWLNIKIYGENGQLLRNNGGKVIITLLVSPA